EPAPIARPNDFVRSDPAIPVPQEHWLNNNRRRSLAPRRSWQTQLVRQRRVDDLRLVARKRPGVAGGAGHLLEMNWRQSLVNRTRGAQPSAQLRRGLVRLIRPKMTTAAGERLHHSQLIRKLASCQLLRVLLVKAGIVTAQKLHAQLDHVGGHRPVLYFALVPADDHVVNAVAMAIDAAHTGADVEVEVGVAARVAQLRLARVTIIAGVGPSPPRNLEHDIVVRVELRALIL